MTPVDTLGFVGAIVTGVTVFARTELLRPSVKSAYVSNPLVRLLMDATAMACVFVAFEIWGGAHLPDGVAWFLALCAVTSTAMLISMNVHDGRLVVAEVRHADASVVADAVHEALPDALDAANARLLDRLDPTVPGYRFSEAQPEDEPGSPASD